MALIELLNNKPDFFYYYGGPGNFTQKKLEYSKDRPGGGSSGLPYIKFGIDPDNASDDLKKYFKSNAYGLDFPIRGGSIEFNTEANTTTPSNTIDKQRIQAFMKDNPRGEIFLLKQVGLQLSNPKIQTGTELFSINTNQVFPLLENTRVYNRGKNTLAQVGVQGTGIRATRVGIIPFNPIQNFYENTVSKEMLMSNEEAVSNNRLLILNSLKMVQESSRESVRVSFAKEAKQISQLGIAYNRNILFEYLGGPGSVYGIGRTTIKRSKSSDTTKAIESPVPMTTLAMSYEKIRNQNSARPQGDLRISDYQDFRSNIDDYSGKRLGTWDNKSDSSERIDIRFFDSTGKVDKLNSFMPYFQRDNSSTPWQNGTAPDDLIKFGFECISNDKKNESTFILFRAFLGSISDNNQASLNAFKYMGRGESFYTYGGFDRSISFGFKVVAMSREELIPNYEKLNYLISQTYPDYHPVTGIMRAPLIKLTIGDHLSSVPGFLESVNMTIDQNSPWEIEDGVQLAHYIDVTVSFKPIFKELPQRSTDGKNNTSIISAILPNNNLSPVDNNQLSPVVTNAERITFERPTISTALAAPPSTINFENIVRAL